MNINPLDSNIISARTIGGAAIPEEEECDEAYLSSQSSINKDEIYE